MPGLVFAWGGDSDGQLGDGGGLDKTVPVQVKGPGGVGFLTNIKAVSAGWHSLALGSKGAVYAWGTNTFGQLGDGGVVTRTTPVQVKDPGGGGFLSNIKAVSAARYDLGYG